MYIHLSLAILLKNSYSFYTGTIKTLMSGQNVSVVSKKYNHQCRILIIYKLQAPLVASEVAGFAA